MQQRVDRSSMLRLLRVCQLNSIAVSRQTSKRTVPKALKFARFRVRTPIKKGEYQSWKDCDDQTPSPNATTLSIVNKHFMVRNLEKKVETTYCFIHHISTANTEFKIYHFFLLAFSTRKKLFWFDQKRQTKYGYNQSFTKKPNLQL